MLSEVNEKLRGRITDLEVIGVTPAKRMSCRFVHVIPSRLAVGAGSESTRRSKLRGVPQPVIQIGIWLGRRSFLSPVCRASDTTRVTPEVICVTPKVKFGTAGLHSGRPGGNDPVARHLAIECHA